jgi:hypothetical protein
MASEKRFSLQTLSKEIKAILNKDLIFMGLNQIWTLLSGPILLILIPTYLTAEVQGYWFTFSSFSALTAFADLGFFSLILQFAAHEFAHLHFDSKNNIEGEEEHLRKLASLFRFMVKWIVIMGLGVYPFIFLFGFSVLSSQTTLIQWIFPYSLYIISIFLDFPLNNILYFTEGCNSVANIQRIRLITSFIYFVSEIVLLLLGFGLFALSIPLIFKTIIGYVLVFIKYRPFYSKLYHSPISSSFDWKKEILPLLLKYAISFGSGYLIFSIYNPIMFTTKGAIEAGKIGLTLTLFMGLLTISSVWLNAVGPQINIHVALKQWKELDQLFFKRLILSLATFLLGSLAFTILLIIFRDRFEILSRFSNITTIIIVCVSFITQVLINGLAIYLRAHKQEPLVIPSLISAIYCLITTLLCAHYLSVDWFMLGFVTSYLWGLPWTLRVFYIKKKVWHEK